MTAEIAIMNKEAIALAADSAVTLTMGKSNEKVFISANKLFMLSKYCPVGIMIYQNATFMGVNWETIIKIYRNKLGQTVYKTLEEYALDFIEFIENDDTLFPEAIQDEFLKGNVYGYSNLIKEQIKKEISEEIRKNGEILNDKVEFIIDKTINEHYNRWNESESLKTIKKSFSSEILNKYGKLINNAIKDVFEDLPISSDNKKKIRIIASQLFSKTPKDIQQLNFSGIVIAGFGKNDVFHHLFHLVWKVFLIIS